MAFLPIIYTSLLVVFGLFTLVFSISYISYRYKSKPVRVASPIDKNIKKQVFQERINKVSIQNLERQQVPDQNVIRINENKSIKVINSEREIINKHRPKKQKRFSIINADETRKFNQFSESVDLSTASQAQTLTISDYRDIDFLKFYDE